MTEFVELSGHDMSAHEIEGPQRGVDLNGVAAIKQQAAKTAMAFGSNRNVEIFPHGGLLETRDLIGK